MKYKKHICYEDVDYFYQKYKNIKKIKQDTVFHEKKYHLYKKKKEKRYIYNQELNVQYFNSNDTKKICSERPVEYIRENVVKYKFRKFKNENCNPEIFLDVHGLNQKQTKIELSNLIIFCQVKKIFFAAIIHGHGKNILKKNIPVWLSQHPDIIACYQAPKKFGYDATLFVLIDYDCEYTKLKY
ncbi:endonuclease SmrB [Buchnera aphidicola]|uniref:endonuclease SmrB n=1 Tax=Buchnera aphidicola TaxID=9 RepID=UPI0031B81F1D